MPTLRYESHFAVDADRLFALMCDLDALDAVNRPWLQYYHLPSGIPAEGQVIDISVSFGGILPITPYQIRVTRVDPVARQFCTTESGAGLTDLSHCIEVFPEPAGARISDTITYSAGWRTPFAALFLRVLFSQRQARRQQIVTRAGQVETPAGSA